MLFQTGAVNQWILYDRKTPRSKGKTCLVWMCIDVGRVEFDVCCLIWGSVFEDECLVWVCV